MLGGSVLSLPGLTERHLPSLGSLREGKDAKIGGTMAFHVTGWPLVSLRTLEWEMQWPPPATAILS